MVHDVARMKRKKNCVWCGKPLEVYEQGETCYRCKEIRQEALARQLEVINLPLNVKQASEKIGKSEGHIRRVLEHPERYPWPYYHITSAYKVGKNWEIFFTPLDQKEQAKLLINIAEGALNILQIKRVLGLNAVFTHKDMISLLESQITPLPRRKSPQEWQQRLERIKQNVDRYVDTHVDRLATSLAEIINDWCEHDVPQRARVSAGQQLRSAGAGPEHRHRPGLNSAES